ncbi:MAG: 1-deoxy-D-xylulose-5-phosphate reductoisomerase [Planctomycetota bacterium]
MSSPAPSLRRVSVLGATGSIGTATIDVVSHLASVDSECRWQLQAVSGHRNLEALEKIHAEASPKSVIFSEPDAIDRKDAERRFSGRTLGFGPDALVEAASDPEVDIVVASIVGRAGLESTIAAVESGKQVALANKETLVVAGGLVRSLQTSAGAELLPVDSEHSAIWQCLAGAAGKVRKLILTASGGPFRQATRDEMAAATPESALAHPTWQMGRKITIDSATMMNKALEVIEARWLFDIPSDQIEVVIHPQSIIHSMVEFEDGSVLAQLSPPDMRLPIQYALTYPRRLPCPAPVFDRSRKWDLSLEPADLERFPALELGFEVARVGGTAGAVVNAANEVAVGLFLDGQIRFTEIVELCRKTLENHDFEESPSLTRLLELDQWARQEAARGASKLV